MQMNHNDLPTRGPQLTDAQRTVIRIMLNAVALILTAGLFESIYLEGFFLSSSCCTDSCLHQRFHQASFTAPHSAHYGFEFRAIHIGD
jgi:hypothetical protein